KNDEIHRTDDRSDVWDFINVWPESCLSCAPWFPQTYSWRTLGPKTARLFFLGSHDDEATRFEVGVLSRAWRTGQRAKHQSGLRKGHRCFRRGDAWRDRHTLQSSIA